jgi:hypothetical protein
MRAMGIPYTAAHGTIRFSLSRYNTEEEVDRVIDAVPPIIAQLRKLSPYWSGDGPLANPEQAFPAGIRLTLLRSAPEECSSKRSFAPCWSTRIARPNVGTIRAD